MTQQLSNEAHSKALLARHFKPLAGTFGAEIDFENLDVDSRLYLLGNVAEHLTKYKVLVMRNANLNRAQFHQLSCAMGRPLKYAFSDGVDDYPEMIEIRRAPDQVTALSTMWHSDSTYLVTPPDATLLYGVEIPPYGGTTLFADTAAAFDDLSLSMRNMLRKLRVVQRSDVHANNERLSHLSKPSARATALNAVHAAVNRSDGVDSIYVSQEHSAYFEGMTREESLPLFKFLAQHITADKYRLEVTWRPHTLLVSDNRKTQHRAIDNYFGHSRTLLRLIVQLASREAANMDRNPPLAVAA